MLVAEVAASPSTTSLPLTKPWASIPVRIVRRYNKPATLALARGDVAETPSITAVFIPVSPYAKPCRRRRRRVIRNDQSPRATLWSWDITKLKGSAKWTYFYLYVILDVFSRYVVGWMVAPRETAELAKRLIADTCEKQNIQPGQLTLHADRGSSMKSKPVAFLLADLAVTKSHSRPYVSDDNPYSESHFRTLKYRPDFPGRFGCIQDSRAFCQSFFAWYNDEHRHSGIELLTPSMAHYGHAGAVIERRQVVLDAAYQAHPERFVRSAPKSLGVPQEVWINKPSENKTQ